MKMKLLLTAATLAVSITNLVAGEPVGKILGYGIFKRAETEEIIKTPETPSGVTRIPVGSVVIAATTNRIPARLKVLFGIRYEIANLDLKDGDFVEITKLTSHPPMKKPDGKVWKSFTFVEKIPVRSGKAVADTGYSFDHDYELVSGIWKIEMKLNGKTLLTQEFTVYKE